MNRLPDKIFQDSNNWIIAHLIESYAHCPVFIPFTNTEAFPPDGRIPSVKTAVYSGGVKIWTEYE